MMFLLGRHAILGQEPPIYLRSTTATRFPSPANVHAASVEPVPHRVSAGQILRAANCWRLVWTERFRCCSCDCPFLKEGLIPSFVISPGQRPKHIGPDLSRSPGCR